MASRLGLVSARHVLGRHDPADEAVACRLKAVILLAGALRPGLLQRGAGRVVLALPVEPGRAVLDVWREQVSGLATHLGMNDLPMRVLLDHGTAAPGRAATASEAAGPARVSIERDPAPLRGTGGLLRDIAGAYDDNDRVLVVDAGQLLHEPLWLLFHVLSRFPGDMRLLARRDGAPAGVMLLRCGCLRDLPDRGFVDFKEQALPRLATRHEVRVARWRREAGVGTSVRTLHGYLDAVRRWHSQPVLVAGVRSGADMGMSAADGRGENGYPVFALIEPGSDVARSAVLHDAVVLAGGCVEAGATVVRCVVGPGGCVRSGQTRVNALVSPRRRLRWAPRVGSDDDRDG
ncbi:MAG: hypothetical protein WD534_08430 [Phycisphaeraceae bacterium]